MIWRITTTSNMCGVDAIHLCMDLQCRLLLHHQAILRSLGKLHVSGDWLPRGLQRNGATSSKCGLTIARTNSATCQRHDLLFVQLMLSP
jgi:hypothetical protein